jgi:hypothetical protein
VITPTENLSHRIYECLMVRCIGWWRDAAGSPPISTFDPAIDRATRDARRRGEVLNFDP